MREVREMTTYQERILRYRILRHEELPPAHKAEYRLRGMDPDDMWSLVWSFNDLASALMTLENCVQDSHESEFSMVTRPVWRIVDAGQETVIEREAWF
jgi:hypothetical protein